MKQLGEQKVADFMTTTIVTIEESARLSHALRIMDQHRFNCLPVLNEQQTIVGTLSTSDLIEHFHEIQSDLSALNSVGESTRKFLIQLLTEQGDDTRVKDVMTSPVDSIQQNTNLVVAARMLTDRNYHHLPVVDDQQHPLGIISTTDLVRALAEYGPLLAG